MKTTTNERRISIKKLPILTIPTIIAYLVVLLFNVIAFDKAEFKKYYVDKYDINYTIIGKDQIRVSDNDTRLVFSLLDKNNIRSSMDVDGETYPLYNTGDKIVVKHTLSDLHKVPKDIDNKYGILFLIAVIIGAVNFVSLLVCTFIDDWGNISLSLISLGLLGFEYLYAYVL